MNFIYQYAHISGDKQFASQINKAATSLYQKLEKLNVHDLAVSDYTKRYLQDHQRKMVYSLQVYSFMLMGCVERSKKSIDQLAVVENGGGTGLLCLLAKEAGAGTVIYNDIYDVACADFKVLSDYLELPADHIIEGQMKEITAYINKNQVPCDVIASRNVIEHVYDLNDFFIQASEIYNPNLVLFMATTANEKNLLVDIYTKGVQKRREFEGMKSEKWGEKKRDSKTAYLEIRKNIIREHFQELKQGEVEELAKRTRGMIKDDILTALQAYIKSKTLPPFPKHRTNTCDPMTGNWTEHLVSVNEYKAIAEKNGFEFKVAPGFYNTHYGIKILNLITPLVNLFMKCFPGLAIYAAPFMVLECGKKS